LGLPIKIKQDVIFDYLYINDLIPVVEFFLKNKKYHGDFNITPDQSVSLKEVAEIINKISKKPSKIRLENKKLNFQYSGNNLKLKSMFPNLKITSTENAIKELYLYYNKTFKTIDKEDIIQDKYFYKIKNKT
jgi:GDP-L-fucose synthase